MRSILFLLMKALYLHNKFQLQEIHKEVPRWTLKLRNDKFNVIAIGVTDVHQRKVQNLGYLIKERDKRRKIVRHFLQQSNFCQRLVKGSMRARRRKIQRCSYLQIMFIFTWGLKNSHNSKWSILIGWMLKVQPFGFTLKLWSKYSIMISLSKSWVFSCKKNVHKMKIQLLSINTIIVHIYIYTPSLPLRGEGMGGRFPFLRLGLSWCKKVPWVWLSWITYFLGLGHDVKWA